MLATMHSNTYTFSIAILSNGELLTYAINYNVKGTWHLGAIPDSGGFSDNLF